MNNSPSQNRLKNSATIDNSAFFTQMSTMLSADFFLSR